MKLILDEREASLRDKCLSLSDPNSNLVSSKVLPLGDALITDDEENIVLLVERKSLSDLLASIKDGRYEEQSHRLIHSSGIEPHHIVYIIEGMMSQLRNPIEKKMAYSAMTTLQVFKGFSVLRTCSVQETAEWLLGTMDKMTREIGRGKIPWTSGSNEGVREIAPYCSVVKKVKKDNVTPENIGEIVLCQIPGISSVSAVAIMREFKSLSNLMNQMRENPHCLGNIVCESKGKMRKLSKTIAQNVASYLLYEVVETTNQFI
jgi:ERCC4-type nuclease